MESAKQAWLNDFDWREQEEPINSFPNFEAITTDEAGNDLNIHFLALFSKRSDAVPLALLHGWPGSVCEFFDVLSLLTDKYRPDNLPYHIIVPSLPGYAFSDGPPLHSDYSVELAASAIHNLMSKRLGFKSGYLVQGGDLGSFIARILALKYEACRGMHVDMMPMPPADKLDDLDDDSQQTLRKAKDHMDLHNAFVLEQGSKTSTVGLAMSASPLALLAWLGEKYLAWSDDDLPIATILGRVSLYWLTDTFPRCLYHHRGMGDPEEKPSRARVSVLLSCKLLQIPYVAKPCGLSSFAKEIMAATRSQADLSCNLVSYNEHENGGHFAAMERPEELLADIDEYVKLAWKGE